MLKMLHFFNWIKWHPTKFLHVVDDALTRWVVLFAILAVAVSVSLSHFNEHSLCPSNVL